MDVRSIQFLEEMLAFRSARSWSTSMPWIFAPTSILSKLAPEQPTQATPYRVKTWIVSGKA